MRKGTAGSTTCSPPARCSEGMTTPARAVSACRFSRVGWPARSRPKPYDPGRTSPADVQLMRRELGAIVGAQALDERAVRDLWPLGLMEERDGLQLPKVLVARPTGREQ